MADGDQLGPFRVGRAFRRASHLLTGGATPAEVGAAAAQAVATLLFDVQAGSAMRRALGAHAALPRGPSWLQAVLREAPWRTGSDRGGTPLATDLCRLVFQSRFARRVFPYMVGSDGIYRDAATAVAAAAATEVAAMNHLQGFIEALVDSAHAGNPLPVGARRMVRAVGRLATARLPRQPLA